MSKYRPFVSLDLETTGIGDEVDVLQISMVFDNGKPVDQLETFDVIIKHKRFHEAEPFALWMNADLIQIIKNNTDPRLQLPAQAFDNLCSQLLVWQDEVTEWDKKNNCNMKGRHIVAGKNAASFDKPKLLKLASRVGGEKAVKRLSELWSYKTLDLGSAFFPYYGYMPSLSEINKDFTGRAPVSHNALDDAWDVVYGTRKLFELRSEDE